MDNKAIQTNITSKDVVIKIPKKFIIEDFNEMFEEYKVKGNRKTDFIKEFTKHFVEYIENNDVLMDIYEELCEDDDIVKEIDE